MSDTTTTDRPTGTTDGTATGDVSALLPSPEPVRFLEPDGTLADPTPEQAALWESRGYSIPSDDELLEVWRGMVVGRRFDAQATALTKQGRLAVYPSSRGQDACQVAPVLALGGQDWFFPTYRDSMALVSHGIDPVEVLTLLRGDWHCGYDPVATRTAPQCTPLSTQVVHAAGAADGMRRRGTGGVALAFIGDGATSEGDFHEGLNFAGVFDAPLVVLVQNNRYAISVPLAKQTKAPSLAYKGVGYGVRSEQVDGNDAAAVLAVMRSALEHARAGKGPVLVEAHTYRMEAHTNADDATRYRTSDEVDGWTGQDPIVRLQAYLVSRGVLHEARIDEVRQEAEAVAADLRTRMHDEPKVDPMSLFEHVYAEPTPQLREQAEMVRAEVAGTAGAAHHHADGQEDAR